jgi:tight adherence protein C
MNLTLAHPPTGLLAADMPEMEIIACTAIGLAITVFAWWLFRVLQSEDLQQGSEWRYDVSRINELRRVDLLYRVFYPVIQAAARINRKVFRDSLPEMQRHLQAAGLPRFWLAEEYLGKLELLALFATPFYVYWFVSWFNSVGILVAMAAVIFTVWFLRYLLARRAAARLKLIKRRMPFLLDLLTLLMEAGATFLNAMKQAVQEFERHPVAEEFGRVLTDMNMGKTRVEAFQAMRDRLADDEITSIIGSILQGEQLGTPLGQVFRTQADVLRLKRSQRAEVVAGEAGVNMLLPGILVMASTVLIILGPFLLNYLKFGMSM